MFVWLEFKSKVWFLVIPEFFIFIRSFYLTACAHLEGHETKAMLNNRGPRYKRSKIEQQMNMDIFFCVGLLFVMCLIGALGMEQW